jgi:hypothetical protein
MWRLCQKTIELGSFDPSAALERLRYGHPALQL